MKFNQLYLHKPTGTKVYIVQMYQSNCLVRPDGKWTESDCFEAYYPDLEECSREYLDEIETPLGEQIDGGNDEFTDNMTDTEADADVLRSAGMGTDEDYGGGDERY